MSYDDTDLPDLKPDKKTRRRKNRRNKKQTCAEALQTWHADQEALRQEMENLS